MYNQALLKVALNEGLPTLANANREERRYQVSTADLADLEIAVNFKGGCVVYLGTKEDPNLAPLNPDYQFDNIQLDRLINVTMTREWTREEHAPRRGILLMGEKGTGKSTYIRQRLARQGIPCTKISCRPDLETVDLLYSKTLIGGDVVVEKGAITMAAEAGYPVVLEEVNLPRPGQIAALNEVIDTGTITIPDTGEVIHAKRGFCVFATCNGTFIEDPTGVYAGTRSQNVSVLDRFYKFYMEQPSADKETAFLKKRYPDMEDETAVCYGRFVGMVRDAAGETGREVQGVQKHLSLDFSRRNLIDWVEMTKAFAPLEAKHVSVPKYALGPVYTAGLPDNEVATVEHLFDLAFNLVSEEGA